jgi:alpha-galactosidase
MSDLQVHPTARPNFVRCRWTVSVCLAVALSFVQARGQGVELESAHLRVRFDDRMHRTVTWPAAQNRSIVAFDPSAQEGLEIQGVECATFRLDPKRTSQQRVTDPEFGPALEGIVAGVHEDRGRGLRIERRTRVLLPDESPVALFQTTYSNAGPRPVRLDRVYSLRILLDRRLAEPDAQSWDFASFQGGAYRWSDEYTAIRLRPGFAQTNFQGVDDVRGPEGVGGGMPFVDVWGPAMGVALAHLEKTPQWLSLPVRVRPDFKVEAAITESPLGRLGQQEWLKPGQSYQTVLAALIFHRLDYFDPLRIYGRLLRKRGVAIPETSPPSAYEPYWKSWGFQREFTTAGILTLLPELKSMGILMANLDDGWYDYMGDWQVNRAPGKFPNGDADMIAFVRKVHDSGFRTGLWWYPFGVSPKSALARNRSDLLVQDEFGQFPLDPSDLYQLCPAYEPALKHVESVLRRVVSEWGFDGVYTDFQGLSAVPACFNTRHGHKTPLDSFQAVPRMFALISDTLHSLRKDPYHEVCICALPHSPYAMPYYDIANASDPVNAFQVRSRVKAEKAIRGGTYAVGDCYQVPMDEWLGSSVPQSFESAMGTGAQLTTFYKDLDPGQLAQWQRWFREYRALDLGRAEYVNLYDLVFDRPEVHVVRKGEALYYGIFAEVWPRNRSIELRGLAKETEYEVYDYANRRELGKVNGSRPQLRIAFKESLLLRVRPATSGGK